MPHKGLVGTFGEDAAEGAVIEVFGFELASFFDVGLGAELMSAADSCGTSDVFVGIG